MSSSRELADRTRGFLEQVDHTRVDQLAFRGEQYDAGLAWVHFPVGKGGLGLSRADQSVVDAAFREAGVPYQDLAVNPIGIGMGAPTVLACGDDEMHERHLRPIFTGEEIWCQLFSEPTHGSDVAGIPSRAVRDGDDWIVNGQKVWTSLGHLARFGMLLTRTNPDVPKHHGLSYERAAIAGGDPGRGSGPIATVLEHWHECRDQLDAAERAVRRRQVTDLWIRAEVLRLTLQRAKAAAVGGVAGPEGSVGKLASAELFQDLSECALALQGARALLHEPGYPMARNEQLGSDRPTSWRFLRSRAATIEGGTSEIMRNILGERVLGLPGDIRVDKDVPWNQIPP